MLQSNLFHGLQQRSSLEKQLPSLIAIVDTTPTQIGADGTVISYGPERTVNAFERAITEQLTFNNVLTASWAPWAWLPLTGTAGLNTATGHDVTLLTRDISLVRGVGATDTLGHYGVGQNNSTVKTLKVNTQIPGLRGRLITGMGFELDAQSTSDIQGSKDTLALGVTTPPVLDAGATQSMTSTATYGWFFEPRLTVSERFFLTPGFRLDGGNANGGNASVSGLPAHLTFAALFPKVNFSWVALDRQDGTAPPLFGILTLLRPRLALGSAGVQPTPQDRLRLLQGESVINGVLRDGVNNDTLVIGTLGNTLLRPERSFETEGGVDAEAWHGRVSAQVTYARKMQHDAIISVPVAPSVYGGGNIKLNVGQISNSNFELQASLRPIETPQVSWSVGGNLSHNDNKVIKLDRTNAAFFTEGSSQLTGTRIVAGYPLFGRWSQPILGYADADGDGYISFNEIRLGDTAVFLGRQDPAYTADLTTDLSLFRGRLGVHANVSRMGEYSQVNGASNRTSTFLSPANETNATLAQQAAYVAAVTKGNLVGLVQTVSAWRFQSLSINYSVPNVIAQRFRSSHMSVALQGSNLGLWTNYKGKDPNVNAFPNGNATADGGQLPQPREWSLQITLGN
jgi:hypothetical protein